MVGNMFGFFFDSRAKPRLVIGPHWGYFVCMFSFIAAIGFTFALGVAPNISRAASYTGIVVVSLCLAVYLAAALKDPGIESHLINDEIELTNSSSDQRYCAICEVVRAEGTEHCGDCDLCIRGYDHHCPWTSKCIGEGNIVYFYAFLLTVLVAIVYVILVAGLKTKPH